jgi:hypothetical protein
VFSNFYNLKPRGIWKFEIPVTSDVGKAEVRGLYVPLKEIRGSEKQKEKVSAVSRALQLPMEVQRCMKKLASGF